MEWEDVEHSSEKDDSLMISSTVDEDERPSHQDYPGFSLLSKLMQNEFLDVKNQLANTCDINFDSSEPSDLEEEYPELQAIQDPMQLDKIFSAAEPLSSQVETEEPIQKPPLIHADRERGDLQMEEPSCSLSDPGHGILEDHSLWEFTSPPSTMSQPTFRQYILTKHRGSFSAVESTLACNDEDGDCERLETALDLPEQSRAYAAYMPRTATSTSLHRIMETIDLDALLKKVTDDPDYYNLQQTIEPGSTDDVNDHPNADLHVESSFLPNHTLTMDRKRCNLTKYGSQFKPFETPLSSRYSNALTQHNSDLPGDQVPTRQLDLRRPNDEENTARCTRSTSTVNERSPRPYLRARYGREHQMQNNSVQTETDYDEIDDIFSWKRNVAHPTPVNIACPSVLKGTSCSTVCSSNDVYVQLVENGRTLLDEEDHSNPIKKKKRRKPKKVIANCVDQEQKVRSLDEWLLLLKTDGVHMTVTPKSFPSFKGYLKLEMKLSSLYTHFSAKNQHLFFESLSTLIRNPDAPFRVLSYYLSDTDQNCVEFLCELLLQDVSKPKKVRWTIENYLDRPISDQELQLSLSLALKFGSIHVNQSASCSKPVDLRFFPDCDVYLCSTNSLSNIVREVIASNSIIRNLSSAYVWSKINGQSEAYTMIQISSRPETSIQSAHHLNISDVPKYTCLDDMQVSRDLCEITKTFSVDNPVSINAICEYFEQHGFEIKSKHYHPLSSSITLVLTHPYASFFYDRLDSSQLVEVEPTYFGVEASYDVNGDYVLPEVSYNLIVAVTVEKNTNLFLKSLLENFEILAMKTNDMTRSLASSLIGEIDLCFKVDLILLKSQHAFERLSELIARHNTMISHEEQLMLGAQILISRSPSHVQELVNMVFLPEDISTDAYESQELGVSVADMHAGPVFIPTFVSTSSYSCLADILMFTINAELYPTAIKSNYNSCMMIFRGENAVERMKLFKSEYEVIIATSIDICSTKIRRHFPEGECIKFYHNSDQADIITIKTTPQNLNFPLFPTFKSDNVLRFIFSMPEQDYRELYVSIFKEIAQKNVPLKFLYLRSIDDNHADRITQAVSNQIDDISELSSRLRAGPILALSYPSKFGNIFSCKPHIQAIMIGPFDRDLEA